MNLETILFTILIFVIDIITVSESIWLDIKYFTDKENEGYWAIRNYQLDWRYVVLIPLTTCIILNYLLSLGLIK